MWFGGNSGNSSTAAPATSNNNGPQAATATTTTTGNYIHSGQQSNNNNNNNCNNEPQGAQKQQQHKQLASDQTQLNNGAPVGGGGGGNGSGGGSGATSSVASSATTSSSATAAITAATSAGTILQLPQMQVASTSSSSSSSNSATSGRPEKITVHLKTSIFTTKVTIDSDKMALGFIKQLAIAFLNEIYFQHQYPNNTYIGDYIRKNFNTFDSLNSIFDRLVLRKYDPDKDTFMPFNSVSDIGPDSYISIEISERQPAHLLSTTSHGSALASHSSNTGTYATPASYQLKISHDFHPESYFIPTHCASCSTLIKGVYKQGFQCSYCRKNFCPKCKNKLEKTSEVCLASSGSSSTASMMSSSSNLTSQSGLLAPNQHHVCQNHSAGQPSGNNNNNNNNNNDNLDGCNNQVMMNANNNSSDKQSDSSTPNLSNMSKRKSASNLLHFNIVNPFKSHHGGQQQSSQQHNQQQQQQQQQPHLQQHIKDGDKSSKSMRGSAGALDPVLQQLSKQMREQQQQQQQNQLEIEQKTRAINIHHQETNNQLLANNGQAQDNNNQLLVVHASQLSSSHQNLYAVNNRETPTQRGTDTTGSSSANQSPSKGNVNQLSNSARASTRDLLHATSPTRRDQVSNHSFISMDWIQINGDPMCGVCSKLLKPAGNQLQQPPAMCKTCKLQVHSQCQSLASADCLSRIAESSRAAAEKSESSAQLIDDKTGLKGTSSNVSRDNIRLHRLAPSVKHVKRPDATKPIIEGWLQHKTLSDEQSRKHYWRLDDTDITLYENDTSTRYFKAIALNKITRVISANSLPKRVKEDILLSDMSQQGDKAAQQAKSANNSPVKTSEFQDQMRAMFGFEVATGSVYLVQANNPDEASRWKGSLESITAAKRMLKDSSTKPGVVSTGKSGTGLPERPNDDGAKSTEQQHQQPQQQPDGVTAIQQQDKMSLQKKSPPESRPKQTVPQRHHHHHHPPSTTYRGQHKTYTDPNRSRLYNRPRIFIKLDPMSIPDHLIAGKYLIEKDRVKGVGFEELGSGQFGKVYAAISEYQVEDPSKGVWSGVPVAIKEISKTRFDWRQQAKLKNEANILSRLDHPGVIILERVHDLQDKIYIVMEQLEDDMLEMIVSTPEKRLNERITKFLTYQILEALKYLHAQNIAHCDLKPENVLLVERRSQFPQIKLCDFGFAKIIEENSFRSSLVGTPAYLAPEVVKGERYNRSVDLWSVGVIVYVSLSGEFPFNEGENIHDQISRANFMYPDQPWAKISSQAKNFINSLLRVNCDKRLSANRAQMDDWIQDFQLWCDLCELELRVGKRWVTDDADFERWSRYARERGLQVPRSAVLLHEQLMGD